MSKRQVIILWAIAVVLGITVTIVKVAQSEPNQNLTNRTAGETVIENFAPEEVAEITVSGVTNTVNLVKKNNQWVVSNRDDYPAKTSSVNDLIRTVEGLKVTRGIEAGPSFAPSFGMDLDATNSNDRGITVTFKDSTSNEIATITIGKIIENERSSSPLGMNATVGRYVRNHADDSGFYAVSEMFPAVTYQPENWLDDDFISPEKIESVSLSMADSDQPEWTVTRESEDAEFKMENTETNEVLNATAASPLKNLFSYARFDDVVPSSEVANRTQIDGHRKATIKTFEGFTYHITLKPELGVDNRFLMTVKVDTPELPTERKIPEGETAKEAEERNKAFDERLASLKKKIEKSQRFENRVYQVNNNTVSPLLKKRSDLITKVEVPKPEPAAEPTQP